jgi:hypothetical protein
MNTEETIAAALARIEAKLDLILEKLKWAPESMTKWYFMIHPGRAGSKAGIALGRPGVRTSGHPHQKRCTGILGSRI